MKRVGRWVLAACIGLVVVTVGVYMGMLFFTRALFQSVADANRPTTTTTEPAPASSYDGGGSVEYIPSASPPTEPTTTTTLACPPGEQPSPENQPPEPYPAPTDEHWVFTQQPNWCFGWALEPN